MSSLVKPASKACTVNPLKSSTPLGAALAFLGVEGSVPLFHGSQGCTSFALVLAVRHFKEAIPLQTTAMNEVSTVLGGRENMEEAIVNIRERMKPRFIGIASTALVETRGEDFAGDLKIIRGRRPELADTAIVFAATPDFDGALEEGWAKATSAIIQELVQRAQSEDAQSEGRLVHHVNVLPGVHQTPADLEELESILDAFGLTATFLPDVSQSLDGSVPDQYVATSLGGTKLDSIAAMGRAAHTLAIGEHMRGPAETLAERTGVEFTVFPTLTGLAAADSLIETLMRLSGREAPDRLKRYRSQLVDSMLDGHFWFSGRRVAIASDPDLVYSFAALLHSLGAEIVTAIVSTTHTAALSGDPIACAHIQVGDLADLETCAARLGAELLITHSHGRQAAERLGVPLFRIGFPIFDRLGVQHRCHIGYRGTRSLIYELANLFMAEHHEAKPSDFSTGAASGFGASDSRVEASESSPVAE